MQNRAPSVAAFEHRVSRSVVGVRRFRPRPTDILWTLLAGPARVRASPRAISRCGPLPEADNRNARDGRSSRRGTGRENLQPLLVAAHHAIGLFRRLIAGVPRCGPMGPGKRVMTDAISGRAASASARPRGREKGTAPAGTGAVVDEPEKEKAHSRDEILIDLGASSHA